MYPAALKNWTKATPTFVVFAAFSFLFPTALYEVLHHPHERIEKFFWRSNKFEKLVRKRDDKLRHYIRPAAEWQPSGPERSVARVPLTRF